MKFYAADPCKLVEEITRYQFFLQVKLDILQGRLPVTQELSVDLAALALQCKSQMYLSSYELIALADNKYWILYSNIPNKLLTFAYSKISLSYSNYHIINTALHDKSSFNNMGIISFTCEFFTAMIYVYFTKDIKITCTDYSSFQVAPNYTENEDSS